jgi:hypothetical protein
LRNFAQVKPDTDWRIGVGRKFGCSVNRGRGVGEFHQDGVAGGVEDAPAVGLCRGFAALDEARNSSDGARSVSLGQLGKTGDVDGDNGG